MNILKFLLMILLFSGLFCSDYNPFENPANVKMMIVTDRNSIYSDTVANIFSSETLYVAGLVREEIDSFSVSVNNNKFFSESTVVAPIAIGNYAFPFSFIDTGYVTVSLTTYRKNGDDINEEFEIHVLNPLNQDTVIISDPLVENLFTNPVKDSGISYYWSFSRVLEEQYTLSQTSNTFTGNITEFDHNNNLGYLWVVDNLGNVSPRREFTYKFIDSTGPVIYSDNEGYNGVTNTIVTGDKNFILKIICHDLAGINTAVINDSLFSDYRQITDNEFIFYKNYYNLNTLTDSLMIIIKASDKLNHISTDTFYIKYDEAGPKEVFNLIAPSIQPYTTGSQTYDIQMGVINLFNSPMFVVANHIEGAVIDTLDTLAVSDTSVLVRFPVTLTAGDNVIIFSAFDSADSNSVIKDTVLITYSSTVVDDNPPQIIRSVINGYEEKNPIISTDTAILELNAYDDNLDSVIINGNVKNLSSTYKWYDTLVLSQKTGSFSVRLVDKSGNATDENLFVTKNISPYISDMPLWPKTLVVGTPWQDTLTVADEDGDSLGVLHRVRALNNTEVNLVLFNKILNNLVQFNKISRYRWEVLWDGKAIADTLKGKTIPTAIIVDDFTSDTSYNWDFSIVDSADAKAFDFTLILPDFIDTTAEGAIDLSQITDTVVLNGKIESNSQTIGETDTITMIFNQQTVKYNSTNGTFDIIIDVSNKKMNSESIIIAVTDTLGYTTIVDTLNIVYTKSISTSLMEDVVWDLRTENNIIFDTLDTTPENAIAMWVKEGISIANNPYAGGNPTTLIKDIVLNKNVVHFDRENKSSIYDEMNISNSQSTFFVVARLADRALKENTYCLFSSSGSFDYTGFGISGGYFKMIGDSTVNVRNSRGGATPWVLDNDWHIYAVSSNGISSGNDDAANKFTANLWVDGYKTSCDTCVVEGVADSYPFVVYGGGAKHIVENPWDGDIYQIVYINRALAENEVDEITNYIAYDLKININKYKKDVQINRSNY